jgi:hypothetical protein
MPRVFLLLIVALLGVHPALALVQTESLGWKDFRNDRFGLVMRYPSAVFASRRSAASGDGDLFETPDGRARLLVGALENADHFTPRSYQGFIARQSYPGLRIDYAPVGQSWAVLSGTIGQTMVYEKVMFSCGGQVINSFAMTYPVAERRFYDPLIEDIEDTFRPAEHGCGQHAARY